MNRIPEPELMTAEEQARAYAQADFESAHSLYPPLFAETFPNRPARALVLDIGCGPCDVTIRFARANPGYTFHAVDGSAAMLKFARERIRNYADLAGRFKLIEGFIPGAPIPEKSYDVIMSSSFLHHLHDPQVLWSTVRQFSKPGTLVFIVDLFRPESREQAEAMTERHAGIEPLVLKHDFFNSLLAAFTPEEIESQLAEAGLARLQVRKISDRHLVVAGKLA
jgi:ubiquinone/menaquinone biosynthesis C-methylase UbiE